MITLGGALETASMGSGLTDNNVKAADLLGVGRPTSTIC